MKTGCCTGPENLGALEKAGYDFIDLPGSVVAAMDEESFARTAERLRRSSLSCEGFHASVPGSVPLAGPACDEAAAAAYFAVLCRRAEALGCPRIGIGSPAARNIPPGGDRAAHERQFVRVFTAAARTAAAHGVELLLEAMCPAFGNFITSTAEVLSVLDRAGEPNTAVVLDLFHFLESGESPEVLDEKTVRRVRYLHIAEPGGRGYPRPENLSPYMPVFERLLARGYAGDRIAVEAPSGDFASGHGPALEALRRLAARGER